MLDLSGLEAFLAALPAANDQAEEAAAEQAADLARENVAVDTGELQSTIRTEKSGEGWAVVADGHAIPVELGTLRMAARPFLTPASRDPSLLDAAADALKSRLT